MTGWHATPAWRRTSNRRKEMLNRTLLVAAVFLGGWAAAEEADLLLHNGIVFTAVDGAAPRSAVAVRGETILAVGGEELLDRYQAEQVIDLDGRFLMPGFNDAHTHIRAQSSRYMDLTETKSIRQLRDDLAEKARQLEPGEWITGYGWSEDVFPEGRRPLRDDLDVAAPDNPVVLSRAGGHSAVANSLALEIGGLDRHSPDPEDGMLERDAEGELNGIIRERQDILLRFVPAGTDEELVDSLEARLRQNLELGITSLTDATTSFNDYERLWIKVYERAGSTLPRATVQLHPNLKKHGLERALADLRAFRRSMGEGDDRLKVGPLKVYVDGGFTGPAAWTLKPYRSDPEYSGKAAVDLDEMYELVKYGHENGWQFGIHAIGDRAIVEAVGILTRVLDEAPLEDHRHYLNHFTVIPPAETMKTMAEYDIGITQQPNFAYTLEPRYREHLDGARLAYNNPVGTPMRYGVRVALSSDILPIGPMVGLYAAVTRKGVSGEVYGEDDRIPIEQALRAYTWGGAYQHRDEQAKGTLEAGKLADMVILSQDLLSIAPGRLLDTRVDMTIIGGRVVFERPAGSEHSSGN